MSYSGLVVNIFARLSELFAVAYLTQRLSIAAGKPTNKRKKNTCLDRQYGQMNLSSPYRRNASEGNRNSFFS